MSIWKFLFGANWAEFQFKQGNSHARSNAGNRKINIELAIDCFHKALQVYTKNRFPEKWADVHINLGSMYRRRLSGDYSDNLELSINCYLQALTVYTKQTKSDAWAIIHNNLVNTYLDRINGSKKENIELAIKSAELALEIRTLDKDPIGWSMTQNNLGNSYLMRIEGSRGDNVDIAISHFEQALQIRTFTKYPFEWATTHHNLGMAYAERLNGKTKDNLENSIENYKQALKVRTKENTPNLWSDTQNNLGNVFADRVQGDQEENLEQAINHFHQALEIRTFQVFPYGWAETQNNLALVYRDRIKGDKKENLMEALLHFNEALKVFSKEAFPDKWAAVKMNLGNTFFMLSTINAGNYLDEALKAYHNALSRFNNHAYPSQYFNLKRSMGHILFIKNDWAGVIDNLSQAIKAGDYILNQAFQTETQRSEIRETGHVYAEIAFAMLMQGNYDDALLTLDLGKTRYLKYYLKLSDVALDTIIEEDKHLILYYRTRIGNLEQLLNKRKNQTEEIIGELGLVRKELELLTKKYENYNSGFMSKNLTIDEIFDLIPLGGVLIAPLITSAGSAIFIIPYGTKQLTQNHVLWLHEFTVTKLNELLEGTVENPGWSRTIYHSEQNIRESTIHNLSNRLWNILARPIHEHIQSFNVLPGAPLLLLPQGGLGLLPLHAAWHLVNGEPHYLCDSYTITYIPSAYALHISRKRATQSERQARSLFAAVNPTNDPELKHTPIEVETIAQCFPPTHQTILQKNDVTTGAFQATAKSHTYIHYSGHGYYHLPDPAQSSLKLADKDYTLSDILDGLDLSLCRLVTLSACETGIINIHEAPDEYVGLPAGFLQAGAPAVISSLWTVDDLSTMLLMERFYQLHLHEETELARALRQAQLWLRDVTAGELANRFGHETQQLFAHLTKEESLAYWDQFVKMDEEERPFAHPYYWAAFTFTGA